MRPSSMPTRIRSSNSTSGELRVCIRSRMHTRGVRVSPTGDTPALGRLIQRVGGAFGRDPIQKPAALNALLFTIKDGPARAAVLVKLTDHVVARGHHGRVSLGDGAAIRLVHGLYECLAIGGRIWESVGGEQLREIDVHAAIVVVIDTRRETL